MCGVDFGTKDFGYNSVELPALAINHDIVVMGSGKIIRHLSKMGHVLKYDSKMTDIEKADLMAFTSLVEETLYKSQTFNWWGEIENYKRFTHNIYLKNIHDQSLTLVR